jgi:adenylyl-sulfate kinase
MTQPFFTLWFTGLSGSGKTTISNIVAQRLLARNMPIERLDGDVVRTHLSQGLGFSKADRDTNIRRIGWVAQLLNRHHVHVIVAAISPYRQVRDELRAQSPHFIEVFCDAPISVLAERDPKGLYKQAMAGTIKHFTGVDDPYEPPQAPELHFKTDTSTPEAYAQQVLDYLQAKGF